MVDVKELAKLTPEELKEIQSVLRLFRFMGITDEQLSLLPQVLANWNTIANNMNLMAKDVATMKGEITRLSGSKVKENKETDTSDNIRMSVGFDSSPERIDFSNFGGAK